jgi:hypothetical protein
MKEFAIVCLRCFTSAQENRVPMYQRSGLVDILQDAASNGVSELRSLDGRDLEEKLRNVNS